MSTLEEANDAVEGLRLREYENNTIICYISIAAYVIDIPPVPFVYKWAQKNVPGFLQQQLLWITPRF